MPDSPKKRRRSASSRSSSSRSRSGKRSRSRKKSNSPRRRKGSHKKTSRSPSEETRKKNKKGKEKSSSSSGSSRSPSREKAKKKSNGGEITIGRKISRTAKTSSVSSPSSTPHIQQQEETNTKERKVTVDKSDKSLFRESSGSNSGNSNNSGSRAENGSKESESAEMKRAEKSVASKDTKVRRSETARTSSRPNPDTPLTLPEWCGFIEWHCHRNMKLNMTRQSEQVGSLSIQKKNCYVIGRNAPQCDIVVDHPSLSRRHAVILHHKDSGRVYVMDLKSTQGTWVNRRKLIPNLPTALTESCTLSFGTSSRVYQIQGLVPGHVSLSHESLERLAVKDTLANTQIEGVKMGKDGPLPFHTISLEDKQTVHDEPLSHEKDPSSKPSTSTPDLDTSFVPAEPSGAEENSIEEKLKRLTPAARLIFLRKQEEEKAATARTRALKAMSATVGSKAGALPLGGNTENAATKEMAGLYESVLTEKKQLLDAKQQKILLNGAKIPSISASFRSANLVRKN